MPTDLHNLVDGLIQSTIHVDLPSFLPELVICGAIFAMLLVRVAQIGRRFDAFYIALAGTLVALYYAAPWRLLDAESEIVRQELFGGMLLYDGFTVFIRSLLLLFVLLFVFCTKLSGIPDKDDSADFYCLILGATLGMCLMASANHLLMVFLAVEMASVPSYALAGLLKGRKQASEAALKYSVYGAGAAGIMLYGISLIAGVLNSAHLPTLAAQLAANLDSTGNQEYMVLALGGLMVGVGLAFKLSAVPFHFWCPDVFEGASAEVNAFLSVASKAAALALLIRVAIGFGTVAPDQPVVAASDHQPLRLVSDTQTTDEPVPAAVEAGAAVPVAAAELAPVRQYIALLVAFVAAITCTFGNLAAYGQTNIKRLMAYSTIAHAGYMMMPVPAVMAMADIDPAGAKSAVAALGIYMGIYLFMNLGAFAIIAFLRNAMHSEEIADYAGLVRRCPITVVCFSLILFSLIGMPPLAGFVGKFAIFASLVDGYKSASAASVPGAYLIVLLVIGGLNTAISLFYYLRVIKAMTIEPERQDRAPFDFSEVSLPGFYTLLITIPTVLLFFFWDQLSQLAQAAAAQLLS